MTEFREKLKTFSGFTISVKPVCPYYMDFLEELLPLKDDPVRTIDLAGGDSYDIPFEWDESLVGENGVYSVDHEDYGLSVEYVAVQAYNAKIMGLRSNAREDYLLATAIDVIDGPIDISDSEWKHDVEGAFVDTGFSLPRHPGALKIWFLKTQVITLPQERSRIIEKATHKEVSEVELLQSLGKF